VEFAGAAREYGRDGGDRNARATGESRCDGCAGSGRSDRPNWINRRNGSHRGDRLDGSDRSARRDRSTRSASFVPGNLFDVAHLRGR